jgi:hypothetical protein
MPDDLRKWLVYVNGDDRCPCRHEWKGLGVLYGVSMGDGWVRITTEPDCPQHNARKAASN